jgi:gliding motility-associated-like protein
MKKSFVAFLAISFLYASNTKAQLSVEGTWGIYKQQRSTLPPSVQNGNSSVNVSYSVTSCGLNYVAGSVTTEQRVTNPPIGSVQPAAITISGMPVGAVIIKAFLYGAASGNGVSINATLTNPSGTSNTYSMSVIGSDITTCWPSFAGSYSYRADVTSNITGNGNYFVSGLPVSNSSGPNDVDGVTLLIIYDDPTAGYTGTLIIADGARECMGTVNGTITGFNIAANSTYANSFAMISDLQQDANFPYSINGSPGTFPFATQDWWNFSQTNTSFSLGQTSCSYQFTSTNDCYNIVAIGLYYQSNSSGTGNLPPKYIAQCNSFSADTLNAGSGFSSYQWSTGATTQTVVINSPGTYWVKTTSSGGCVVSDTIKAYTINPAGVDVLHDTTICSATGNYVANATFPGAISYQWYDGSTNPIKTINASGTYSVNIYFTGGCVVNDVFTLALHTLPNVNLGNDTVICGNIANPITLNAGAGGGYTYHWSTGASSQTISVSGGGNYFVKVTNGAGCSAIDSINILVVGAGVNQVFDTAFCSASSFPVVLHAPVIAGPNNTYYWSNGYSGTVSTVYYPGTVFLTIDVNGGLCQITDVYHLVLDTARPHIKDILECSSFKPDTITAGYGYANYLWSTGVTTYSLIVNSPGTYWVKTTSNHGCTAIDTFKASIINPANVNVLKDTMICSNYYPYYYANAYVNGAQSYLWYDGYTTSPYHYFNTSGSYYVDIHFAGGCFVRDDFNLTLGQSPYVNLGYDEAICGPLTTPITLDAGFGYPHYQWSTGATTEGISVSNTGIYWVTVTSNSGCKTTDSINIQIYPYGNTTHVYDTVICNKYPPYILSTNIPGYNNSYWSNGYYGSYDYVYSAGTYYVTVNIGGNNYCTVTDTFHLITGTITKPVIPNVIQCNTSVPDVLDAGPGYTTYNWSTGATSQSITVNTSGNYIITVTNNQGCKISDTVKINYYTSPAIDVLQDIAICDRSSVTFNASYPTTVSYLWNDGYTYPVHTISSPGHYSVTYTLNTTCVSVDTFNVNIKNVQYIDSFPNIITPNNDGINDILDFGPYTLPSMKFEIYNRWGVKINESDDPQFVWKPTCDDGTYFYVFSYIADCDLSKKITTLKGFITVVR